MKKTPYLYNTVQSEEIQEFISNNFGKDCGYIAHEIKSEYVHTDTMLIAPQNTDRTFVTFGMGTRKMNTPNNAKRCELVMCAISAAIPEKGEILSAIKSTLEYAETGDENSLNIFNYEQNIAKKKEEAKRIMLLMTTTEGDTEKYEIAISKIYDEIRVLREELDTARKQLDTNVDLSAEIKRLMEIFERDDLNFKEFDDCVIRRITECIRVMGDKSIIITLKGGFELREKI